MTGRDAGLPFGDRDFEFLAREVSRARRAARDLARRVGPGERQKAGLLGDTLESLEAAVEELDVAEEELRQQHEALLHTREQLERERARFQDLFDAAPDAYMVTDPNGVLREMNRAALAMLRTSPTFAVGKPLVVFADPEERRRLRTYLNAAGRLGGGSAIALRLRPRLGDPIDTEVTVSVLRDEQGRPALLRWIARDVSERRRAEARIRALAEDLETRVMQRTAQLEVAARLASELLGQERAAREDADRAHERLSFLASAGALLGETLEMERTLAAAARLAVPAIADLCAVVVTASDGRVVMEIAHDDPALAEVAHALRESASSGPTDAFGLRRVLRSGITSSLLAVEEDGAATVREIARTRGAAGELVSSFVTLPLIAAGRALGAMVLAAGRAPRESPFPDDALIEAYVRRAAAAVENARLHAELRLAHRQQAEESRRKSTLFAVLSHELRTPLQSIGGYAELMRMGVHGALSERQAEDLDRIQTSQDHVLRIVDEVLEVARMERGALAVEPRPVAVEETLSIVGPMMAPQFADRGLHFTYRPGDPMVAIMADPERLRQILLNLLTNAVRYTEPGGDVALEWEVADGQVLIHVCDTGQGIPADKLEAVFEPFTQLRQRRGAGSGIGLGLALSREFARLMEGDLTVSSELGRGSVFTLALPLVPAERPVGGGFRVPLRGRKIDEAGTAAIAGGSTSTHDRS